MTKTNLLINFWK